MLAGYRYPTTTVVYSDRKHAHHAFNFSGEDNLCLLTRGGSAHLLYT